MKAFQLRVLGNQVELGYGNLVWFKVIVMLW